MIVSNAAAPRWLGVTRRVGRVCDECVHACVAGPAPQHRDGARDRGGLQHGQDLHRHGLRGARPQGAHGDHASEEAGVPARSVPPPFFLPIFLVLKI